MMVKRIFLLKMAILCCAMFVACRKRPDSLAQQIEHAKVFFIDGKFEDTIKVLSPLHFEHPGQVEIAKILAQSYVGLTGLNTFFLTEQWLSHEKEKGVDAVMAFMPFFISTSEKTSLDIMSAVNVLEQTKLFLNSSDGFIVELNYYRMIFVLSVLKIILNKFDLIVSTNQIDVKMNEMKNLLNMPYISVFERILFEIISDIPNLGPKSKAIMSKVFVNRTFSFLQGGKKRDIDLSDQQKKGGVLALLNDFIDEELLKTVEEITPEQAAHLPKSSLEVIEKMKGHTISPKAGYILLLKDFQTMNELLKDGFSPADIDFLSK